MVIGKSKSERVKAILIAMSRWVTQGQIAGCAKRRCLFETHRTLLKTFIYQEQPKLAANYQYTQKEVQQLESIFHGVKTSPLLDNCDIPGEQAALLVGTEPLDLWDCQPEARNGSHRYYRRVYEAALSYYGLELDYKFYFSPGANHKLENLKPKTAADQDRLFWLQINPPIENLVADAAGYKKASDGEILKYQNFTIDFEYSKLPAIAHVVGVELSKRIADLPIWPKGFLAPPVEDSGAGCHLVIPITGIFPGSVPVTTKHQSLTEAAKVVREHYLTPEFNKVLERYGVCKEEKEYMQLKLGASDISRTLSVPGTWRPGGRKSGEAEQLLGGYVRRWLPPYTNGYYPMREENEILSAEILKATELAQPEKPKLTVVPKTTTDRVKYPSNVTPISGNRLKAYVEKAFEDEVRNIQSAPAGTGNDALFAGAVKLAQLVAGGYASQQEAYSTLLNAATGRRSKAEANSTIKSGFSKGLLEPRVLPKELTG